MTAKRKRAAWAVAILATMAVGQTAEAQTTEQPSCAQRLTRQLRRFSEQCIADLVTFAASLPKGSARIESEKDKYYVVLTTKENGLQGESVSRQNHPFVSADTENRLKALGWTPPEVEFGGFKRHFAEPEVRSGAAARAVVQALQAYGMMPEDAMSVTVGESEK